MPNKRNPISSEMMLAGAKIVREQHAAMLDAMVADHERATGQWHVEWHALPTAFIVASGALRCAYTALAGLEVQEDVMRYNLDITGGLIAAEAVMMGLATNLGRQRAHDMVYECCRESLDSGRSFVEILYERDEIAAVCEQEELEKWVAPANYTGNAPDMARRYLERRNQQC